MKNTIYLVLMLFVLAGCIEPYNAETDSIDHILVVEGIITGETTQITLSKSVGLEDNLYDFRVNNAIVYVECENGARSGETHSSGAGKYLIETGELDAGKKYRLVVKLDGEEYHSEFLTPAISPPVNVSFKSDYNLIDIYVSTTGYDHQPGYYLWSFKEDWEKNAVMYGPFVIVNGTMIENDLESPDNRYYCWQSDNSKSLIKATTEKLIENSIRDKKIHSFACTDDRTYSLYRITVWQNTIHKEYYDFLNNIEKNSEQTGSIFGNIPSEIMGNIRCVSSPGIPVIGYVDVSTTSTTEQYLDDKYYNPKIRIDQNMDCERSSLVNPSTSPAIGSGYVYHYSDREMVIDPTYGDTTYRYFNHTYVRESCVDCTKIGGSKRKPENWRNDHQ